MKKPITLIQLTSLVAAFLIITSSITTQAAQVIIQGVTQFGASAFNGTITFNGPVTQTSGQYLAPDGTSLLPSYSFANAPAVGFWRSAASTVTLTGSFNNTGSLNSGGNITLPNTTQIFWSTRTVFQANADGLLEITNNAGSTGSSIKVDALPTIASGFGTSPSITAGSTPFVGSVNVGTGASSSGIINFNGTAFPSAPFCVASDDSSILAVKPSASTTQLTLSAVAFTASDVISWVCISSK